MTPSDEITSSVPNDESDEERPGPYTGAWNDCS